MPWVKILVGCQVACDRGRGLTKHIKYDGIKRHIADGKGILEPVLFAAFHTSEFVTVTGQFTQNTDILGQNKTFLIKSTQNRSLIHLNPSYHPCFLSQPSPISGWR